MKREEISVYLSGIFALVVVAFIIGLGVGVTYERKANAEVLDKLVHECDSINTELWNMIDERDSIMLDYIYGN